MLVPTKKIPAPFTLAPRGWPPVGLMWKNLIAGRSTPRKLAWFASVVVVLSLAVGWGPFPQSAKIAVCAFLGLAFAATGVFGSVKVSAGLRQDLGMLDVVKVYPLPGWQIVLGEMLGPAIAVSAGQMVLALGVVLTAASIGADVQAGPLFILAVAIVVLCVSFPLNFVNAVIPSAATLLFPAWAATGKEMQKPGFETIGPRLIFGLAQLVILLVAFAPVAAVGAGAFFLVQWLIGPEVALVAAGVCAGALLAVEAGLGVFLLGYLFDRYDVSSEV
jgi:hypothetical protein